MVMRQDKAGMEHLLRPHVTEDELVKVIAAIKENTISQSQLLLQIRELLSKLSIPGGSSPSPSGHLELKMIGPIQIIQDMHPYTASTTYYPIKLADCLKNVDGVLLAVFSTCDQAVTIQAIGCLQEIPNANNVFNIKSSESLAAGAYLGMGLNVPTDLYPYMGVSVASGGTPPTVGSIQAFVYLRKWEWVETPVTP